MIVDKAAIAVRLFVEFPDGRQAKMREVVTEFLEVFLAQQLLVPTIWAPRHTGEFYSLLLLFANGFNGSEPSTEKAALYAEEPAPLVHIPRSPTFPIRVRRPVT